MEGGGRGSPPKKTIAQNDMKHILVLEFLRSDDFLGVVVVGGGEGSMKKFNRQPTNPMDNMVTR